MLSDVMEDYLKAIYTLQRDQGPPVRTSAIADHLDVTPPTVTSMVEKLTERGLLTPREVQGRRTHRRGRDGRHRGAAPPPPAGGVPRRPPRLRVGRGPRRGRRPRTPHLRGVRGAPRPETRRPHAGRPHGDPIPGEDLEPPTEADTEVLADHAEGDQLVVARVSDREDEELRYLADAGVEPGIELELVERAPIGMFVVRIDGELVHLPERVATSLRVRPSSRR